MKEDEDGNGSGRSSLPPLNEAQKRAKLVHSLKQQICKLEKELAMKLKEETKAASASFAGPGHTHTARKRK